MSVKLREKQLKNGNLSLYLDIYHRGKRNYEFLNIHVVKPARTSVDRQHNKQAKALANSIRSKRELELQASGYEQTAAFKRKVKFLDFAKKIADEKKKKSSRKAYELVIRKIEAFAGSDTLTFEHITKQWCEQFYEHLLDSLSINTAYDQFTKFSYFMNVAVRKEII
ncbi:MAG: phage integrase SAM-like domain-containing protein, partial [Bacteroidota bacterium]